MKASKAVAYAHDPDAKSPAPAPPVTPTAPVTRASASAQAAWADVKLVLRANFEKPDIEAVKVAYACAAAHRITDHAPAWQMVIGPPGSIKTTILEPLQAVHPCIRFIDEVTPNTFVSGKLAPPGKADKGRKVPAGLLQRMGNEGVIVSADFGTVIHMNTGKRATILAQLRRIYDGQFSREFGSEEFLEEREWKGRLTYLTASTPEVDHHHKIFQSLGERFLYVRIDRAGGEETGMKALQQTTHVKLELVGAVSALLAHIFEQETVPPPAFPLPYLQRLAALGEFITPARANVPRDSHDHKIVDVPIIEGNTRCPQQLAQLARGWAVVMGRKEVTEEDLALSVRAAFDSIPPLRAAVVKALIAGKNAYAVDQPHTVTGRALEDLEAHKKADPWKFTDSAHGFLVRAGLITGKSP